MQKLILGALIFVVSGFSETTALQKCRQNATEANCGSACPKTCANMFIENMICKSMCMDECACQTGYVLNSKQDCILPIDCNPSEIKCPPGKIYRPTKSAQKTCKVIKTTTVVDDGKPGGCYCPVGLVFEENTQTCIKPNRCDFTAKNYSCSQKDNNSEYVECVPIACLVIPCPVQDCQGCYCKEGFVQDTTKNLCVPLPAITTAT